MHLLRALTPMQAAIACTLFTWALTALGASVVFFFKTIRPGLMHTMMGAGAGIMIAACFWSLLAPSIEMCMDNGMSPWISPSLGLILGGAFILFADRLLDRHYGNDLSVEDGKLKRSILLVVAVTLHNIPEGMVIGVAFGSAALTHDADSAFWGAVALAVGIGLQNFPEGAAVSLPLRSNGMSRPKSFMYGQLSGVVEPIAAIIGVAAVTWLHALVPFLMAFSAGAMIAVVVGELIPESANGSKYATIIGFLLGFIVMMILDVMLG